MKLDKQSEQTLVNLYLSQQNLSFVQLLRLIESFNEQQKEQQIKIKNFIVTLSTETIPNSIVLTSVSQLNCYLFLDKVS